MLHPEGAWAGHGGYWSGMAMQREEPFGMRELVVAGIEPVGGGRTGLFDQRCGVSEVRRGDRQRAQRWEHDEIDLIVRGGDVGLMGVLSATPPSNSTRPSMVTVGNTAGIAAATGEDRWDRVSMGRGRPRCRR